MAGRAAAPIVGDDETLRGEPCGSASPSDSPYSGRSTPNYLLWAEDLRFVLNDYDGLELFKRFLDEAGNRELRFWYVCKGFKVKFKQYQETTMMSSPPVTSSPPTAAAASSATAKKSIPSSDAADFSAIKRLAEDIKAEFIKSKSNNSLQCLNDAAMSMRVDVERKISTGQIDQCLFDNVQQVVEKALIARHALFVQSPVYLNHVQRFSADQPESVGDQAAGTSSSNGTTEGGAAIADESPCPSNGSSGSGSGSDPHQAPSGLLPTVLEDPELECASSSSMDGGGGGGGGATTSDRRRHQSCEDPLSTTSANMLGSDWRLDPHVSISSNRGEAPSVEDLNSLSSYSNASTAVVASSTSTSTVTIGHSSSSSKLPSSIAKRRGGASTAAQQTASSTLDAAALSPGGAAASAAALAQKLTPNILVRTFHERLRATMPSAKPGIPPHPYHTARPYVPYLTTSAQDSEFSSEATNSSVSGAGYTISERTAFRNARQNVDYSKIIPRTKRIQPNDPQLNDMRNEVFRNELIKKLEQIRKDQEHKEKLMNTIPMMMASHETPQSSSHETKVISMREAVQNFCLSSKPGEMDEDETKILDNHYSRLGWKDSPKHSPLRSPSIGFGPFRRRSPPVAKPPSINRIMMSSYPSCSSGVGSPMAVAQLPAMAAAAGGIVAGPPPPLATGSGPPPSSSGSQQHAAHAGCSKQGVNIGVSGGPATAQAQPYHVAASTKPKYLPDSGISSYVSTTTTDFSTAANPAQLTGTASKKGKKFPKQIRKPTTGVQTDPTATGAGATTVGPAALSPRPAVGATSSEHITVIYFLPNEPTPFKTKFKSGQMDLKQFKSLLPKKQGSFKYFFKCMSKDGEVWEEISEEKEIIPFHSECEITARVEEL